MFSIQRCKLFLRSLAHTTIGQAPTIQHFTQGQEPKRGARLKALLLLTGACRPGDASCANDSMASASTTGSQVLVAGLTGASRRLHRL